MLPELHDKIHFSGSVRPQVITPPKNKHEYRPGDERTFAGIEMVYIPPGTFMMGSPKDEEGRLDNEGPQHRVILSRGFWLGKYPVTQGQWEVVMGGNPSYYKGEPRLPVEKVSWDDCQAFCRKLSQQGKGQFRLPTEAEWEYACRAGSTTRYCFGDLEGALGEYAWIEGNSGNKTHLVGGKKPNTWGLYDMHGNVWEWCQDWYGNYSYSAETDPTGPNSGSYRVIRGGHWINCAGYCRSASRGRISPGNRINNLGFRLAAWPAVR